MFLPSDGSIAIRYDALLDRISDHDAREIKQAACKKGWCFFRVNHYTELPKIVHCFSKSQSKDLCEKSISELLVKSKGEAKRHSLSAVFGRGRFPFHTDGAHLKKPPRFILLHARIADETIRPTIFKPFYFDRLSTDLVEQMQSMIWTVSDGFHYFYSPVLNVIEREKSYFIRLDPVCMKPPMGKEGKMILKNLSIFLRSTPSYSVVWQDNSYLLLHNWQAVHARGSATRETRMARVLHRYSIF